MPHGVNITKNKNISVRNNEKVCCLIEQTTLFNMRKKIPTNCREMYKFLIGFPPFFQIFTLIQLFVMFSYVASSINDVRFFVSIVRSSPLSAHLFLSREIPIILVPRNH